tara:strand:- start:1779 stop:2009 length:231 start_codon:yes stop_codon:yes gene_type:complete
MDRLIDMLEKFGIEVVLLLGFSYAFYKFFFFSIREVKYDFTKRHDLLKEELEKINKQLVKLNTQIKKLIDNMDNKK